MARIKIELPEPQVFTTEISINIDQINYGGHVGNDRYLSLMHEARIRWIKSLGYKNEVSIEEGVALFVVDAMCEFLGEVFHGDLLTIELFVSDQHKYGFDLYYGMRRKDSDGWVFKGKTGLLSVDIEKRKATSLPGKLVNNVSGLK